MPKIEFRDDSDSVQAEEVEIRGHGWIVAKVTNTVRTNHRVIPSDHIHQIIEDGEELTATEINE